MPVTVRVDSDMTGKVYDNEGKILVRGDVEGTLTARGSLRTPDGRTHRVGPEVERESGQFYAEQVDMTTSDK